MDQLNIDEIIAATGGRLFAAQGASVVNFSGVSTDSRTANENDLFFALKGPNFDGHKFINDILKRGVKGFVVDSEFNEEEGVDASFIQVPDTLTALGDLAGFYRRKMPAKIIAVTGSNGKTTTKDMIYHLLSKKFRAIKSRASFNNFIGAPLTIFELDKDHEFGVVEMGTNAFGEIRRLSEIAKPDVAIITNVSETHLEGLQNAAGVQKAKAEILEHIKNDGLLLVNSDNDLTLNIGRKFSNGFIGFGSGKDADFRATDIKQTSNGWSFLVNGKFKVELPVAGYYNVFNCLAAIAAVMSMAVDIDDVGLAFNDFKLSPMRMDREMVNIGNALHENIKGAGAGEGDVPYFTIINDAYNANPSSMRAAVNDFSMAQYGGRKIFVAGDMSELGVESERLHVEIGNEVGRSGIDMLWTVGKMAGVVAGGALDAGMANENIFRFENAKDVTRFAIANIKNRDTILIKGSRSARLEQVVKDIKASFN